MAYVKSFTDDQLKEEFEKIRKVQSNSQIQAFSRTLNRTGPVLKDPSSKRQKSTEAPISSVPAVPPSPAVSSPPSSGTRRNSLGRKRLTKPQSKLDELDLDADNQTFIRVVSNEDSGDDAHFLWQILHMVDRLDLVKLYGLVVQYYETHPVAGAGLILWGDLQVLFDSHAGETVSGEVLYIFADVSYPLSVKLMEKMLTHKLEIDSDVVGNDMTTDEQLIQFIKNQLVATQFAQNYRVFNSPMLHLLRVEMVINSPWIMPILGTKELASPKQTALEVSLRCESEVESSTSDSLKCKSRIDTACDHWLGELPLYAQFPRLFALEMDQGATVNSKLNAPIVDTFRRQPRGGREQAHLDELRSMLDSVSLSNSTDRWFCSISGDGVFRVKDVRTFLDDMFLPQQEDTSHIFFRCNMVQNILNRVTRWWDLPAHSWSSFEDWQNWLSSIRMSSKLKSLLEGVFYVTWWVVWRFRNRLIFDEVAPRQPQPQPPKDKRKKRVAKRSTVNLFDDNDEEEEPIRQCAHWSHEEEILLTECWIETFETGQIRADRSEDSFWGQIMDDFNTGTTQGYRTRHTLTGKWTRINGDAKSSMLSDVEKVSTRAMVAYFKRRKLQAGTSAYEAKKEKEVAMKEFKEMEFLTINVDLLPEPKANIIRKRQEKIIAKYAQQSG
nr:RNA-directed DNA polymerase, eukaryota [Tanacetum cinerariifolium]